MVKGGIKTNIVHKPHSHPNLLRWDAWNGR